MRGQNRKKLPGLIRLTLVVRLICHNHKMGATQDTADSDQTVRSGLQHCSSTSVHMGTPAATRGMSESWLDAADLL